MSKLPGLVFAAFTRFVSRFQEEEMHRGLTERDAKTLEDVYRVLEQLSSSRDDDVLNLVQTEVFDNLRGSSGLIEGVVARFGPKTRQLFQEWKSKNA
jgi:hypothetical protein